MSDEQPTVPAALLEQEQAKTARLTEENTRLANELFEARKLATDSVQAVVLTNLSREYKLVCMEEQVENPPSVSYSVDGVPKNVVVSDGNKVALRMMAHAGEPESAQQIETLQTSLEDTTQKWMNAVRERNEQTKKRKECEAKVEVQRKRIKLVEDANTGLGNALTNARNAARNNNATQRDFTQFMEDVSDTTAKINEAVDEELVPV